jgi:hypothetical protein
MKSMLMALLVSLVGTGAAGCVVHSRNPHSGVETVVPLGHVHDDNCGHYHFGGRWYYCHDHRHGPGCGHINIEGSWTIGH